MSGVSVFSIFFPRKPLGLQKETLGNPSLCDEKSLCDAVAMMKNKANKAVARPAYRAKGP